MYSLYKAITTNPGYLPQHTVPSDRCPEILSLASTNMLDARHYCITCHASKPLRSKHCRQCDRCVARFDHHCPWTFNCVGAYNHFYFFMFAASLVAGAYAFNHLVWSCTFFYLFTMADLEMEAPVLEVIPTDCFLFKRGCEYFAFDGWSLMAALWASFNGFWVLFLFLSHLYLVCHQKDSWSRFR